MISDHQYARKIGIYGDLRFCRNLNRDVVHALGCGMIGISGSLPITLGAGCLAELGSTASQLRRKAAVLLVFDPWLAKTELRTRIEAMLAEAGLRTVVFEDLRGEPTIQDIRQATVLAQDAEMVIGIGGGSALDVAKIAAACAPAGGDADPLGFACAAVPLPQRSLPKILVPTTAGTGAESSSTAVFSGPDGRKLWIWGAGTKADAILLDPELTVSLPPGLTAACAMDAFVHAFEASTNLQTHADAQLYGHEAMRLIASALPTAVSCPNDLAARQDLLLGACYAGAAIDKCGTAVAHMISHALAGLAPVSHGLATALAFEATLPWLVEVRTPALAAAASALGLSQQELIPHYVSDLMDRAGIERVLPVDATSFDRGQLAAAMRAPENAPMRNATARQITDADTEQFATMMQGLAASSDQGKNTRKNAEASQPAANATAIDIRP